jgi:integrase
MSKSDTMAKLPGLYERGGVYQLRVVIPLALRDAYQGRTKLIESLKTTDRRTAAIEGAKRRAALLQEFEDRRRQLNPQPAAKLSPDLGRILSERVHAAIMARSDDLRANGGAVLAELAALLPRATEGLTIGRPRRAAPQIAASPLDGLSDDQLAVLTGLDALKDAEAAVNLAGLRLSAVVPLVDGEARKLGMLIDWHTSEARPVLLEGLKAYRKAWGDVVRRDAGEVLPTMPASIHPAPQPSAMTLREVFGKWKDSKPRKAPSTRACELALELFEGQFGSLLVQHITRAQGDSFRAWLQQQGSSSKTARDRFTWIKTLLLYAHRDLEILPRQPWARLDIKHRTESRRRVWAPDELKAFFGLPIYTAYVVPFTTHAGADAAYWIPLLGLYSGATVSELAQLRSQDIGTNGEVPVFRVTNEGVDMTAKNEYRVREVPVHSELVRLGFLEYAAAIKERGEFSLWPTLKLRKDKPGGYFSEWFGVTRKAAPINFGPKPDFHCLRHTMRSAMTEAGFQDSIQDRITGHTVRGSAGTTVYAHPVAVVRRAVEAVRYPSLKLEKVYIAPQYIHAPQRRRKVKAAA